MLKTQKHHEILLKALGYILIAIFIISRYETFMSDMGTYSTTTKGKFTQMLFLFIDKMGGMVLLVIIFGIVVIAHFYNAYKAYNKYKENK
jgi:hypothetical protein